MTNGFSHRPVLVDIVVELFRPVPPGVLLDATVGGGGHAAAILDALPQLHIVGLDRDGDALEAAAASLATYGDRASLHRARNDGLEQVMETLSLTQLSGALFDLGVSSPQFDRGERGFSYRNDGPIDMRMDQRADRSAADVVNGASESELVRILHDYGDERYAGRIAKAIIAARPLSSTVALAEVVRDAIPAPARRRGGHPAKRTFQALRIEVNDELGSLRRALEAAVAKLVPQGRCLVLSYHSGEDRIVKDVFRQAETGGCTCPPGLPCQCGAVRLGRELRPLKRRPASEEISQNPRAASAVLRGIERLEPQ